MERKKHKVGATKYRKRLGWIPWVELLIGSYFALTVYYALDNENYITVPFLLLVRHRLLVHGSDVAAAGTFLRPCAQRRDAHQAIPGRGLSLAIQDLTVLMPAAPMSFRL